MPSPPKKIVTTHMNTDFDGLASVIGATILFPGFVGVIPKMVNNNVSRFLATHKSAFDLIQPNEVVHSQIENLIVVDTDQWHRLDRMSKLKERDDLDIEIWDHHIKNSGNIAARAIHKEDIGATVTLLIKKMREQKIKLSALESTVLLIGLYEDTGSLSFTSTTPEDARAAVFLLENGADLNVASFFLKPPYEDIQRDILFEMLKSTEKVTVNGRKIGFNIIKLDKKVLNLSAIISSYRNIINVEAVFVVFLNEKSCTVIARGGNPAIDVGNIMREFGGGGHAGAASATIKDINCSGEEIRDSIISFLKDDDSHHAQVIDIMSFPVETVPSTMSMNKVRAIMDEKNIRGLVVVDEGNIVGMIVLWDFKKIKKDSQWNSPVKAFMARNITTIGPDMPPSIASNIMNEKGIGYLPVLFEEKLIGIVTRTDVITYTYDLVPD
ncbi:MAG: CBS domain-containing protein [Desulfotalea sp.]